MEAAFYDRDYFEGSKIKPSFWARSAWGRRLENYIEALLRAIFIILFFRPRKVLDVGCGQGELVFWLRVLGVESWGIDVSEYAIESASASIRPHLQAATLTALPFADRSFDLVISFDVLEHIGEADLDRALFECQRITKRLVLHKIFLGSALLAVDDPSHVSVHPADWWGERFARQGLGQSTRRFPKWEPGLFLLEDFQRSAV